MLLLYQAFLSLCAYAVLYGNMPTALLIFPHLSLNAALYGSVPTEPLTLTRFKRNLPRAMRTHVEACFKHLTFLYARSPYLHPFPSRLYAALYGNIHTELLAFS